MTVADALDVAVTVVVAAVADHDHTYSYSINVHNCYHIRFGSCSKNNLNMTSHYPATNWRIPELFR